ncbi:MAG: FHA domain-containing protein [bacterium]|nr:FHA domain-containing protein [bacterium]
MAAFNALFRLQGVKDQEPREFTITPEGLSIGRSGDNALPLPHSQISRQHARIFWKDDQYWIEDLNSSNGAWVNDARIRPSVPQIIRPGDVIRMGPFVLTYLRSLAAPPPLPVDPIFRSEPYAIPPTQPPDSAPAQTALEQAIESVGEAAAETAREMAAEAREAAGMLIESAAEAVRDAVGLPDAPAALPIPDSHAPGRANGGTGGTIVPPTPPSSIPPNGTSALAAAPENYPPGVPRYRSSWLDFLPAIYGDDEFLGRYLLIYESILSPIIWAIDNFDQYLAPEVAPSEWLRWIASWFDLLIIPDLPIERQRAIMAQIGWLFLRRGTRAGLSRLLELYFGIAPEIIENRDEPCHFVVRLPLSQSTTRIGREVAERLIATHKPAFASHTLEIT